MEYRNHDMDLSKITDYDSIKDKIVCKLINGEANEGFLQDKPYTKIEDMAVVYQILLDKSEESITCVNITDGLMKEYGVTVEELHSRALENMEKQSYVFKGISQIVDEVSTVVFQQSKTWIEMKQENLHHRQ